MGTLSGKTLVMCVAPSAMGKSTIMNETIRLDPEFARVRSFTTRPARANDEPGQYFYLNSDELAKKRRAGDIITEVIFPTTGQLYGTLTASYPGKFCLLDTLANSVSDYRGLGFASTITISMTTTPERWREWFLARYPERTDEAMKRLEEARLSIDWSLSDTTTKWLINDDSPEKVAKRLIRVVRGGQGDDGHANARAILELIDKGAIYV